MQCQLPKIGYRACGKEKVINMRDFRAASYKSEAVTDWENKKGTG